jgi:2-dehydropantoate 2-reductase
MGYHTALPNIHSLAVQVIQQTADNLSSMHQDLAAGRPSEIEYITGYLVTQARQLGIACPLNQNLLTRVRRSETNSAGPGPL